MLKDWDRLETMHSMRKYVDGFQDGSGWTEVDGMLCLVSKRGSRARSGQPSCIARVSIAGISILPATLEARRQEIHHILVIETAIKYAITQNIF